MARGDHIKVARLGGLYYHHGIDMGDGTVVHFSGEPLRLADAKVERDSLELFSGGYPVQTVAYGGRVAEPETIVETAQSYLGASGYKLWTNNCEHFACYCVTGEKKSDQVRRTLRAAAGIAATAAAGVVLIAAARQRGRTLRKENV
ncbi:MAG: hypothetical protein GC168_05360 [Candidatus Hydrogenedens sp.]|nr:hypothetical protein [Candidatus Hydrogenedens sp.]